jgi:hypothetical protein
MAVVTAVCLLVTGCGSFHHLTGRASASRTSTPGMASAARVASGARLGTCQTPEVPRSFPSSTASNRNLVIAKLRGSDQWVIRDVTDIGHPSTVTTVDLTASATTRATFVSASTISYVDSFRQLVWSPLSGAGNQVVAAVCESPSIEAFAWSPDGQSFTYLVDPEDPASAFQWHLVAGGVDRVIGTAPLWCYCGEGNEDMSLAVNFSLDGQSVSLVEYVNKGTDLQVRRLDGSVVGSEIRGDHFYPSPPTMGVWSGTNLFFRDKQGVERWTDGAIKPFLPGVAWLDPRASPNGDQIAYAVRGSDHFHHVSIVDLATGQVHQLSSQPRTSPFYLTPRYIWYRGVRQCAPGDPCIGTEPMTLTGKTYVYDLQTGIEYDSLIADVVDTWPHGA